MRISPFIYYLITLQVLLRHTESANFPFAAYRFTLVFSNYNFTTIESATLPFSEPFTSNCQRSISLAGLQANMTNQIDFKMYLEPAFFNSSATITVQSNSDTIFASIVGYITLVESNNSWIWMQNYTTIFTTINIPSGSSTETVMIPLPSPSGSLSEFQFISPLTWFHGYSQVGADIGMTRSASLQDPDFLSMTIICTNQAFVEMGYFILVYNTTVLDVNKSPVTNIMVSFSTFSPIAQPTTFGLQTYFAALVGGFDKNCVLGFFTFEIAADDQVMFQFNTNTNPISGINIASSYLDVQQTALCMMVVCPSSYYYNETICIPCIKGCRICQNTTECITCLSTYYLNGSSVCPLCSADIPNCYLCDSSTYCTQCVSTSYGLTPTHTCPLCSVSMPHCRYCTNSTYCTSCYSLYGIDPISRLCNLCSSSIFHCRYCSISTVCTSCVNLSYGLDPSFHCVLCSISMPNCSTCLTTSKCLSCQNNSYGLTFNYQCVLCYTSMHGCLECLNSTYCTLCQATLFMETNHLGCHSCYIGWYVGGLCTTIVGCIQPVEYTSDIKSCLACNPIYFHGTHIGGICACLQGWLVGGGCTAVLGCITVKSQPDGSSVCQACNTSKKFQFYPRKGRCQCRSHYQLRNGQCSDICGDGFLETHDQQSCDDGNLQEGDGCSSFCRIQVGFRCQNGSSVRPSKCVYVGVPISLQVKSIRRNDDQNRGIFKFKVYPPLVSINKMNLYDIVNLTCQADYEVSSITYVSGVMTIIVDYSSDMEERVCSLNVAFDSNYIRTPTTWLNFTAQSETMPLIIFSLDKEYKISKLIFLVLAYSALALFLLSLAHKMIGAELLTCCQLVYFSICFYNPLTVPFSAIKNHGVIRGYYPLFMEKDGEFLFPFSQRVDATHQFIGNSGLIMIVLMFLTALLVVFLIRSFFKKQQQLEANLKEVRPKSSKIDKVIKILYDWFIFPIVAGFLIVLSLNIFVANLRVNSFDKQNVEIDGFGQLSGACIVCVILGIQFLCLPSKFKKQFIGGQRSSQKWYIPLFLFRAIAISLILSLGITFSFQKVYYPMFILQLLYALLISILRPYSRAIDNIGIIFCQSTVGISILLPLLDQKATFSQTTSIIFVFLLEGLIILSILLSLVRLAVIYRHKILHFCKKRSVQGLQRVQHQQQMEKGQLKEDISVEEKDEIDLSKFNPYSIQNQQSPEHWKEGEELIERASTHRYLFLQPVINPSNRFDAGQLEDAQFKRIKRRLRQDLIKKRKKSSNFPSFLH